MKEQKKCVPEIRFAGFTDDWEQRKLGEVLFIRNEIVNQKDFTFDIELENIESVTGRIIGNLSIRTKSNSLFKSGDILFGKLRPYLKKWWFAEFDGVKSNEIWAFSCNSDVSSVFMYNIVQSEKFLNATIITSGTKMPRADWHTIKNLEIMLPTSKEEQTAIGNFFRQLDNTIALHQRTLEKYQKLKISYLEKMFPKENEQFPELRFPNFTDAWEQRKLGDVLTESRIIGSNGAVAKKLTVKLWKKGVIAKEEQYAGSLATQYFVRKSGQFIYGKLDFLNQAFGIIPKELDGYESTLDSPAFDISKQVNENFLLEYIARDSFYLLHGNIANGSRKAKRIHSHTLLNMPFIAPNLEEQTAIGNFFKQLDDTIALHQRFWVNNNQLGREYAELF